MLVGRTHALENLQKPYTHKFLWTKAVDPIQRCSDAGPRREREMKIRVASEDDEQIEAARREQRTS